MKNVMQNQMKLVRSCFSRVSLALSNMHECIDSDVDRHIDKGNTSVFSTLARFKIHSSPKNIHVSHGWTP